MKKDDMMRRAIGGIDDDLIEGSEKMPVRKRSLAPQLKRVAVAAAAVLILAVGIMTLPGLFGKDENRIAPEIQPESADSVLAQETAGKETERSVKDSGNAPETPEYATDAPETEEKSVVTAQIEPTDPDTNEIEPITPPPVQTENGGTDDQPGVGTAHAVYTSLSVSYEEAKEAFGHPISECGRSGFAGYKIGIVSQNGNVSSPEAFCQEVRYEFADGTVIIRDQERSAGKIAFTSDVKYDYQGRTFYVGAYYEVEGYRELGYFPNDTDGLSYVAYFDDSVDAYEVMELLISLEIR